MSSRERGSRTAGATTPTRQATDAHAAGASRTVPRQRPGAGDRTCGGESQTTHGAAEAVDACRYFAGLLIGALQGRGKDDLLSPLFAPIANLWADQPLSPAIDAIARGSYSTKDSPDIRASGYVVHTLEAALWAFARSNSFEEGALLAVNLGEDADTTGAVYGQVAGAFYGAAGIPDHWRRRIAHADLIAELARRLAREEA